MRAVDTKHASKLTLLTALAICSFVGGFEAIGDGARVEILEAFWGSSGNLMAVGPGDKGAVLTLVLQNSGSEIVSGVNVYLHLRGPFHNLTGGDVAKGYVANVLQPGQLATVQFLLNVDEDASVGQYGLDAKVSYMTLRQTSETQSSSISESEQKSSSTSKTSTSQSSSTSSTLNETNTISSSKSDTSQTSTLSTKQISSSSSFSYTKYSVDSLEQAFNLTVWVTGKVILDVNVDVDSIFAGAESAMPIRITNRGSASASSLSVTLTLPPGVAGASSAPLILLRNDNYWYFQYLPAGGSITIEPALLASNSAIDGTFQVQVLVSYRDNVGTLRSEQRNVGILVKGPIRIVLQDVAVVPSVVGAGGNVTVSGTIMNEGVVSAMYMNASLLATPPFLAYNGASAYIGEVSPNTPMPFSLSIGISRDAENRTYVLPLLLYYKDNYHNTYSIELPLRVTVQGVAQPPPPQQTQTEPETLLRSNLAIFALVVTAAALSSLATYFVTRRRSGPRDIVKG